MQRTFNVTRISRNTLDQYFDAYTLEQLNEVPPGFSNNLIWNIAHVIVVQQMLVYNLSGLPMMVSREMADRYKRGTRPEAEVTADEAAEIRRLLQATIAQTEKDWESGIFKTYQAYKTTSGFHMQSAADAFEFNNYHEAMHTGIMMGIRKFL